MIFEKIKKLFSHYLYKENSKEELVEFRKQFEVIFDFFRQELEDEIGTEKYELFDEIYMIFELYESDEKIRMSENYCIDENTLICKIRKIYERIIVL